MILKHESKRWSDRFAYSVLGLCVLVSVSYFLMSMVHLKYSAILFVLLQAIACYLIVLGIKRSDLGFFSGLAVSVIAGWVVSFFLSVLLEAIFFDKFFVSLKEQLLYGNLIESLVVWWVISFSYGGVLQAVGTFILLRNAPERFRSI